MSPAAPEVVADDALSVRKEKRAAILASGNMPYAYRFDVDAHLGGLADTYATLLAGEDSQDRVAVAGRIMAVRNQGKAVFIVVRDGSGEIQLFCRIDTLGEDKFAAVKELDVGDFVGCTGTIMRTRRGQLSLLATDVTLLSKSLRPLPEKFHGLSDKETRYRQRYIDLLMNPNVKEVFSQRFKIITALRSAAVSRGFVEVETPMLHPIPGGATARPFVTQHNTLSRDFYLRVAPELHLKRLLVGGFEKVFELNRSFRNEGMDPTHNPEFTTLEAYQAYTDAAGIANFTRELIQAACLAANGSLQISYQGTALDLSGEWPRRPLIELVSQAVSRPLSYRQNVQELEALANGHHIATQPGWGAGKIIVALYDKLVEKTLIQPIFVTDHPLETSPLAKRRADNPDVTDRYELVICGREYANLFSELNDPVEQRQRFKAQMAAKAAGDEEAMGYDEDYIRALEYGMPPAGGVGIGVDRLVMLLTDTESIRDVLLFPHMRDESF
ncbi:MAG: lysine--tRNA ligase [Coriobacteriales bacterium]|nr:lysine--tRNA ligase [Coriobacteriales bacterium]